MERCRSQRDFETLSYLGKNDGLGALTVLVSNTLLLEPVVKPDLGG